MSVQAAFTALFAESSWKRGLPVAIDPAYRSFFKEGSLAEALDIEETTLHLIALTDETLLLAAKIKETHSKEELNESLRAATQLVVQVFSQHSVVLTVHDNALYLEKCCATSDTSMVIQTVEHFLDDVDFFCTSLMPSKPQSQHPMSDSLHMFFGLVP